MNTLDRLEKLEEQPGHITEQETIIPKFQNPDTCVFCTEKDYDSIFYLVFRLAYNYKKRKDFEKQDKETCIHHTDDSLKYSLHTAGFIWSALTDHGKKSMTEGEILELFKNKQEREKILTNKYEEGKKFTCAAHLYLTPGLGKKNRYSNAFTIEDDIAVQNKILQNKLRIYYNKAIEVLRNFDDEKNNQSKKEL